MKRIAKGGRELKCEISKGQLSKPSFRNYINLRRNSKNYLFKSSLNYTRILSVANQKHIVGY